MTFTIPEFWIGVLLTLAVSFAILLVYGIISNKRSKNGKSDKN